MNTDAETIGSLARQLMSMESVADALEAAKSPTDTAENVPLMCAISEVQMAMGHVEEALEIIKAREADWEEKCKRLKLVQCARVTLAEQFDMLLRVKEKNDISMEVAMQGLDSAVENLGLVVDRLLEEVRYADDIHSEEK